MVKLPSELGHEDLSPSRRDGTYMGFHRRSPTYFRDPYFSSRQNPLLSTSLVMAWQDLLSRLPPSWYLYAYSHGLVGLCRTVTSLVRCYVPRWKNLSNSTISSTGHTPSPDFHRYKYGTHALRSALVDKEDRAGFRQDYEGSGGLDDWKFG